jgi:translation elongation factor EF-Tu-like GTPase
MSARDFRFRVREAFELAGRGTVLIGYIEEGDIASGTLVIVHHDGNQTPVTCSGVEGVRDAAWRPGDDAAVGLRVPGLRLDDVGAGDLVTGG